MDEGISLLENACEAGDLDVENLLNEYKKLYPRPHWKLVEDT